MKTRWMGAFALSLVTFAVSAHATTTNDIKDKNGKLIGHVSVYDDKTNFYCENGNNGLGYVPFYTRRTKDYTQDVRITQREVPGYASHVYTFKPNGNIYDSNNNKVGSVTEIVGTGGTSYTVWFTDAKGNKRGYAYWSLVSSGIYDASNKLVGTMGTKSDNDMRIVAFFFFYIAPNECK